MTLLSELTDELAAKVRTLPSGAKSLAHLTVIVPTAESARRLRQSLARRLGALVPPEVKTPLTRYLDPADETLATRTDTIAALHESVPLAYARELADLRTLLEPKALSFADVATVSDDERWHELAELEKRYLAQLEKRGKRDRILALKAAMAAEYGEVIDWSDVASVATKHMPATILAENTLKLTQVVPCATPSDEADRIAEYFAAVKPNEAYPALCVADPELFPEIEASFKARGLRLHNPAETKLITSSLGHLVAQVVALLSSDSYGVFSAFIRSGDVRRWLKRELNLDDEKLTSALVDLDKRQAEFLPEKIDDIAPKTSGTLRGIFEFVKVQLRKKSLRQVLAAIFKDVILDERDALAREFVAAAQVISQLVAECGDDRELFALRLEEATYSLEPDEGDVILTDGWMELPFLESQELVIAGLREGVVPESVVGHAFLPDSLRTKLGLPDNAYKETRDRAILKLAVGTRDRDALKIFFNAINAQGDVLKPSRLLFETENDADLFERVHKFYGVKAGTIEGSASDLPENWKLALPIPPAYREVTKISPTRLDSYLRCPFTFYLKDKEILGDKRLDDRAEELASWEYGNLAHEALEKFGLSGLKDSTDAQAIRDFLEEQVDVQLVERFGTAIPAIVAMQGESVKRRLAHFAEIQAKRREEGWRIVAVERKLEIEYDHTRLYGKVDRIDFNDASGEWCVLDYKTFDSADKAIAFKKKKDGSTEWKSLQLALYCAMLTVAKEEDLKNIALDNVSAAYCVLGKTKDDVVFSAPMTGAYVPEAEQLTRELIAKIERGIFWPPAPSGEWKYDYEDWLMPNPEASVSEAWIKDQEARYEA